MARDCGERLLEFARTPPSVGLEWLIPDGYEHASGRAYLGYAHGSAGIADALLDLAETTQDDRPLHAARRVVHHLAATAAGGETGDGCAWPDEDGGEHVGPLWCHGAAGVARFLLHAARLGIPEALDLAVRAARPTAHGARWAGATQCHGLAGNADILIDFYQATGNPTYLRQASELVRLCLPYLDEPDDFMPRSPGNLRTASFMTGRAGLLACFLRLAAPERTPHALSLAAFGRSRRGTCGV